MTTIDFISKGGKGWLFFFFLPFVQSILNTYTQNIQVYIFLPSLTHAKKFSKILHLSRKRFPILEMKNAPARLSLREAPVNVDSLKLRQCAVLTIQIRKRKRSEYYLSPFDSEKIASP